MKHAGQGLPPARQMMEMKMANTLTHEIAKMRRSEKWILQNEFFLATIHLNLEEVMDDDPNGTMSVDDVTKRWSSPFVMKMSQDEVTFVNMHEDWHVALRHMFRRGDRDPMLWNMACDYVVNALIIHEGQKGKITDATFRCAPASYLTGNVRRAEYRPPTDCLFDPKYWGMTEEQIYSSLLKDQPEPEDGDGDDGDDKQPGDDQGQGQGNPCPWGNFEDPTGEDGEALTDAEMSEAEQKVAEMVATAENVTKARGAMSAGASGAVKAAARASVNWEDELQDYAAQTIQSDYTYKRRNRMFDADYLPSMDRTGLGHVGIFTDASGSVSGAEFSQFMADLMVIFEELNPSMMTLIQFDHDAADPEIIEMGDEPQMIRRLSGGTRFSAPFERAAKDDLLDDLDCIIVFTDGGDCHYAEEPPCPVIWASTGAFYNGDPPYGDIVQVAMR
jgi:predicted metal-dependent peptidase